MYSIEAFSCIGDIKSIVVPKCFCTFRFLIHLYLEMIGQDIVMVVAVDVKAMKRLACVNIKVEYAISDEISVENKLDRGNRCVCCVHC